MSEARAPEAAPASASDNVQPGASSADRLADRLIVALDLPSPSQALQLAGELQGICRWLKVGMELYYTAGNPIVETLRSRGFHVFLDLKLHDIPNTVAAAVRSVSGSGASLLTVHAGGGPAMLRAAAESAAAVPGGPRLLAVTVLTSLDPEQLHAVGVHGSPREQVLRLASVSRAAGIPDFVCSAEEVSDLRRELGHDSLLVTPGIRPSGSDPGDQRRTATPAEAIRRGASMLVVGRPVTQAPDPAAAARAILHEISRP